MSAGDGLLLGAMVLGAAALAGAALSAAALAAIEMLDYTRDKYRDGGGGMARKRDIGIHSSRDRLYAEDPGTPYAFPPAVRRRATDDDYRRIDEILQAKRRKSAWNGISKTT